MKKDNVVNFPGVDAVDIDTGKVLDGIPRDAVDVVVVGTTADGKPFMASTTSNLDVVMMQLKLGEHMTIHMVLEGVNG